ncbi:hypothetical protein CISG_00414 [Coccidioides immitis RMSCC 3703]|uniref:Uncharacterized protein n=1 Tax=Coccidioides immitis RMSCC 3703 TaxID=454286 RepID=A0A0J8QI47_COCIT|nr:hypothetical protein CISG_00414 [Coccidioides immitis RMSCC 3703]
MSLESSCLMFGLKSIPKSDTGEMRQPRTVFFSRPESLQYVYKPPLTILGMDRIQDAVERVVASNEWLAKVLIRAGKPSVAIEKGRETRADLLESKPVCY